MAHPIVFISHFTVRAGKLDSLKSLAQEVAARLEAEKPRHPSTWNTLTRTATQMTFVHLFADSEAMDLHFEGAQERSSAAFEFMDPNGWEIYGQPSDAALGTIRQAATSAGVPLTFQPEYLAGFARLSR